MKRMIKKIKIFWLSLRCITNKRKVEKYNEKYKVLKNTLKKEKELNKLLETQEGAERLFREKYIKSKAYMSILIGVVLLLITFFVTYLCEAGKFSETNEQIIKSVISVTNTIISIIIGLGIGTLVLDFFSYITYTRDRIKEIMIDKKYINTLSDKEKENLIKDAEESLYFQNGEVPDNSLYSNIKKQITPLIKQDYLRQYKVHVECIIDEANQCITKEIHKKLEVMCLEDTNEFKLPFSIYLTKIEGVEDTDLYEINSCICNKEDLTDKLNGKIITSDFVGNENSENVKFELDYCFNLNRGLNIIEIKTKTKVPIYDNTYSHIITVPCMRYDITFSVNNEKYDVLGFGYAIDTENSNNDLEKVIFKNKYRHSYEISFKDWTLPGDGCVFVINKIPEKNQCS